MDLDEVREGAPKIAREINEDKRTGCWNWHGAMGGPHENLPVAPIAASNRSVRRFLWLMRAGNISKKMTIVNTCGNDRCVNPSHSAVRGAFVTLFKRKEQRAHDCHHRSA